MWRRKFIALLGSAAAWSVVARAQESVVRIGFLPLGSPSNRYDLSYVEAFRKGLVENDLIDGKNVVVDLVWVANEPEYDQAVVELIRRGAKILVPAWSALPPWRWRTCFRSFASTAWASRWHINI